MMKMTEFLKKLPPKKCNKCGCELKEQHDCYTNHCDKCLEKLV